jgi:inosine/xanthosine triphosphate pyrophosphatase family protein
MKKKLVFGTSNPSKILQVRAVLADLGIDIEGSNLEVQVEEDGATAQANAVKKALAYAAAGPGDTFLAMDNALYLEGLPPERQPGMYVRRLPGVVRATDEQMIQHYAAIVHELGGGAESIGGHWEFGVAIVTAEGNLFQDTIRSPRRFVAVPSPKAVPGYPLESIQIEPESGAYISEMSPDEQDNFWRRAIGAPLAAFIQRSLPDWVEK